jgi:Pentapeptide repeats (8 copies)
MTHGNEACTQEATGHCTACDALVWFKGGCRMQSVPVTAQAGLWTFLRRHTWLIGGGLLLLLTWLIPYMLPTWDHAVISLLRKYQSFNHFKQAVTPFLWTHRLFVGALLICLLFILVRYALFFCGVLLLLLTLLTPYALPTWDEDVVPLLLQHRLFGGALLVSLLFVLLWKLPKWQVARVTDEKDRVTAESGFRQTLAQIVGGAVVLIGLYFTAKTLQTTQQGQITDRFTKAIAQLGDAKLDVWLGGIYALERITKDSPDDHGAVMEVLTASVREHSPGRPQSWAAWWSTFLAEDRGSENQTEGKPPTDIQAILTVIGRRERTWGNGETVPLNLRNVQLKGANLQGANLQAANLWRANLQAANLWRANLQLADLWRANLQGATLPQADLQGANLQEANLQAANLQGANLQPFKFHLKANLSQANLQGANLQEANLQGANLQGANLTEAKNLTQDQVQTACGDNNTKLPAHLAGLILPSCPQ